MRLPPGANADDLIESHVRRPEALRRVKVVERLDAHHWRGPGDFLARAEAFETTQGRRVQVRLLSA
jgi:hypothetical protein